MSITKQLLEEHPDVDGLFAITDLVAVGAVVYCNEKNIEIPKNLKIIGFSNWFMSEVISPKLSTIEQPGFEMGTRAFLLLKEEIEGLNDNSNYIKELFQTKFKF